PRHARRLEWIDSFRPARGHGTESARPRADVAEDHERGGARAPAFAHVGAVAALADRVQLVLAHDLAHLAIVLAGGQFHPQPLRPPLSLLLLRCGDRLAHSNGSLSELQRQIEAEEESFVLYTFQLGHDRHRCGVCIDRHAGLDRFYAVGSAAVLEIETEPAKCTE